MPLITPTPAGGSWHRVDSSVLNEAQPLGGSWFRVDSATVPVLSKGIYRDGRIHLS